jgi:preprotein translocase subunit SecG
MPNAMMTFVLVVHSLIAVALVATILLQRSEGGALGIGGGPGGLMTARGAGNLLTRATAVLAATFLGTSILLAVLANLAKAPTAIDTTLAAPAGEAAPTTPTPAPAPSDDLPFALPASPAPSDEIPTAQ